MTSQRGKKNLKEFIFFFSEFKIEAKIKKIKIIKNKKIYRTSKKDENNLNKINI
jgi:hypothetical protein